MIILIILGILCLGYYAVMASYAGPMIAFGFFWVGLGILFFIAAFLVHRKWTVPTQVRIPLLIVAAVMMAGILFLEGVLIYTGSQEPSKNANYLIVLGAKVNGTKPSQTLTLRLNAAVKYAKENPQVQIIVSGGQGTNEKVTEARAMADFMIARGIDSSRVLLEEKSTNTNENIQFSKKLMSDVTGKTVVVTNDFHVFRGIRLCKKNGIEDVSGLGAATPVPLLLNSYVREAFAVTKDFIRGNI